MQHFFVSWWKQISQQYFWKKKNKNKNKKTRILVCEKLNRVICPCIYIFLKCIKVMQQKSIYRQTKMIYLRTRKNLQKRWDNFYNKQEKFVGYFKICESTAISSGEWSFIIPNWLAKKLSFGWKIKTPSVFQFFDVQ